MKTMKLKLLLTGIALLLLPCAARAWSGDTWASISRATIQANADQMIDSTWVPKNTMTNWAYTSSSSGLDVYYTYTKGVTYTGVAYSQNNPQETWAEFRNAVTNTSGGTTHYGNDCSGFTSICWKLPARKTTYYFESQLGTYWTSLGDIGSAATAPLLVGDALNSSSVGHIVLFLNFESTGVRTMEQTPSHAQRKVRTYSNIAEYRPIRRMQISDAPTLTVDGLSRVVDAGNAVSFSVTASGSTPFAYRWQFNGNNVAGATTSKLTLSAAQLTNAGNYVCVVTNTYGSVTSRMMSLTVYPVQTTVFLDTFDTNSAARWQLNKSSTDTRVTFNYDYSGMGIASAPHSTGGTTRGLRLEANMTAGVVAALSLSPTNQSFAGDYRLRFDLWMNANGPFPDGGTGSSQHSTAGVGTAGNRVQWTGTGSTADGYYFAVDGEGQAGDTSATSGDFCAYAGTSLKATNSGVYTAGMTPTARGNLDPYYVDAFPTGKSAPAVQQADYSQQTGTCAEGTIGFAWHEVIVARRGNAVDWTIDGIRLATITNATFTASNVFVGYWDMFASLSDNTNLSFGLVDNVRVEVPYAGPTIAGQPQSQTVVQGANAMFSVTADGAAPLSYQWRCNGTNLAGASASAWTVTNAQPANAGSYTVVVTNSLGSVTSAVATLTVDAAPWIAVPLPSPVVVTQGGNASFCITVAGTAPLYYQWRFNGASISGATTSCYSRNNARANDTGTYSVTATHLLGNVTGSTHLIVLVPPSITAQPQSQTNLAGGSVTLSVTAAGTQPLSYQWQCEGNAYPPGANALTVSAAGNYSVVVSNTAGMVTSAVATVVFTNAPAQPGRFESICRLTDGALHLDMTGTPGTNYVLEWTSDWLAWSNLCNLSGSNGCFWAVDPCATNGGQRFYRLRLAP
jgi:hypothetical protein